jgi:hypothetical protein
MDLSSLLQQFPKEATILLAATFGSLGWLARNLFQIIIENRKYNKELKTYFWKEKINAAKKASEFYLETLNFFDLVRIQFNLYETSSIQHEKLLENIEREVAFYREKLKMFPHFEYHHINIFYDFDERKSAEITAKTFEIQQKVFDLVDDDNLSVEQLDAKFREYSALIKNNYSDLHRIYKDYVKEVRQDIAKYL